MENNPGNIRQQIAQRIKEANNVLVTVNNNPTVDQLASTIGLTLLLNKLGKHGTAVFSGKVPSTLEFLEPEKTLEKDTNSLRDFIIALDKSKADKLRYKVEDKLVKIFITPYKTSLSDKDLEFSQGDFNVDVVIALGVQQRDQLDQAIIAHGRILHDATVISINTNGNGDLGTMNWVNPEASSLCEMVVSLIEQMQDANLLDGQMATAFLTGIVAETDRFSNAKTSPNTMSISSKLMSAGANQQLIANKLKEMLEPAPVPASQKGDQDDGSGADGSLIIDHPDNQASKKDGHSLDEDETVDEIHIDEHGTLVAPEENTKAKAKEAPHKDTPANPKIVLNPPTLGGTLTANSKPEGLDPSTDAMTLPAVKSPLLSHDSESADKDDDLPEATPPKLAELESKDTKEDSTPKLESEHQTLSDLEKFVDSPHLSQVVPETPKPASDDNATTKAKDTEPLGAARAAVSQAISSTPNASLEPIAALNAQPVNLDLGAKPDNATVPEVSIDDSGQPNFDMPQQLMPKSAPKDDTKSPITDPTAPPPVPPPMTPPSFSQPSSDQNSPAPPVL